MLIRLDRPIFRSPHIFVTHRHLRPSFDFVCFRPVLIRQQPPATTDLRKVSWIQTGKPPTYMTAAAAINCTASTGITSPVTARREAFGSLHNNNIRWKHHDRVTATGLYRRNGQHSQHPKTSGSLVPSPRRVFQLTLPNGNLPLSLLFEGCSGLNQRRPRTTRQHHSPFPSSASVELP